MQTLMRDCGRNIVTARGHFKFPVDSIYWYIIHDLFAERDRKYHNYPYLNHPQGLTRAVTDDGIIRQYLWSEVHQVIFIDLSVHT